MKLRILCLLAIGFTGALAQPARILFSAADVARLQAHYAANDSYWQGISTSCDDYLAAWPTYPNYDGNTTTFPVAGGTGTVDATDSTKHNVAGYQNSGYFDAMLHMSMCYYATAAGNPSYAAQIAAKVGELVDAMTVPMAVMTITSGSQAGQTRYVIPKAESVGATVTVYNLVPNFAAPVSGTTVTISGALGCTSLNGDWTIASANTTSTTFTVTPTANAVCLNRASHPARDSGYGFRSMPPALALAYANFYSTLSAARRNALLAKMNEWVTDNIRFRGSAGHPGNNFYTGYLRGYAFLMAALDGAGTSLETTVDGQYAYFRDTFITYANRWYPNGANLQGLRNYGWGLTEHLAQSFLAAHEAGDDWSALSPYFRTQLEWYMAQSHTTLASLDDADWVAYTVPVEDVARPFQDALLWWVGVARANSTVSASLRRQFLDWYNRVYTASKDAADSNISPTPFFRNPVEIAGLYSKFPEALHYPSPEELTPLDFTTRPLSYCGEDGGLCITRTAWTGAAEKMLSFKGNTELSTGGQGKERWAIGSIGLWRGRSPLIVRGMSQIAKKHMGSGSSGGITTSGGDYSGLLDSHFVARTRRDIASIARSGNVVTITTSSDHNINSSSNTISTSGTGVASLNLTRLDITAIPASNQLRVSSSGADVSASQGSVWTTHTYGAANQCQSGNTIPSANFTANPAADVYTRVDRSSDGGGYFYARMVQGHCSAFRRGSWAPAIAGWSRSVLFLRPAGIAVVYDRTKTARATDERFVQWPTTPGVTEVAAPAAMKKWEVSEGGIFRGAVTAVLPPSPNVQVTNHEGIGALYLIEVYPSAFDHTDDVFLTVLDPAASSGAVETVTKLSSSNIDAVQLSSSGVAGFIPADSPSLPLSYTFDNGGSVTHRIAGLAAGTVYRVSQTANTITIDVSGGGTQISSDAAGVLEFSTSGSGISVTITTASLNDGLVGGACSGMGTLGVTGGTAPYTWSVASGSFPGGCSLAADGTISGTFAAAGSYTFTLAARDAGLVVGAKQFVVQVTDFTPLRIATTSLPGCSGGASYSQQLVAEGGAGGNEWSVVSGALPAGISLSAGGLLSGSCPSGEGVSSFTVEVRDAAMGTDLRELSITVSDQHTIAPPSGSILDVAQFGMAFSQTFTISGGNGPHACALTGGGLPAGLALTSACAITGTPTEIGSFTFVVTATGSDEREVSGAYTLNVRVPQQAGGLALTALANAPTSMAVGVRRSGLRANLTGRLTAWSGNELVNQVDIPEGPAYRTMILHDLAPSGGYLLETSVGGFWGAAQMETTATADGALGAISVQAGGHPLAAKAVLRVSTSPDMTGATEGGEAACSAGCTVSHGGLNRDVLHYACVQYRDALDRNVAPCVARPRRPGD